ncbi:MAG: hypothetical protein JXR88_02400 [Clostridia bacterium]|nr:hypothetical protein [Clostridia bacterium]
MKKENCLCCMVYLCPAIAIKTSNESPLFRFHLNQGLTLWSFHLAWFICGYVPYMGKFFFRPIGLLVSILLTFMGMINGLNGYRRELPLIGNFRWLNDKEM